MTALLKRRWDKEWQMGQGGPTPEVFEELGQLPLWYEGSRKVRELIPSNLVNEPLPIRARYYQRQQQRRSGLNTYQCKPQSMKESHATRPSSQAWLSPLSFPRPTSQGHKECNQADSRAPRILPAATGDGIYTGLAYAPCQNNISPLTLLPTSQGSLYGDTYLGNDHGQYPDPGVEDFLQLTRPRDFLETDPSHWQQPLMGISASPQRIPGDTAANEDAYQEVTQGSGRGPSPQEQAYRAGLGTPAHIGHAYLGSRGIY
ncbi:MAG: hypothetical protein Q9217_000519 [Psora testacea]